MRDEFLSHCVQYLNTRGKDSSCEDTTCFDEVDGDDSLDGPGGKVPPEELETKWLALRNEYAVSPDGVDDCRHLC